METEKKSDFHGIPQATFIEDIEKFLGKPDIELVRSSARDMEISYQQYKRFKQVLDEKKYRSIEKLPLLNDTYDAIQRLKEKPKDFDLIYPLADQVFANAHIDNGEKVYLWIGCNVMVEYSLEEAEKIVLENRTLANDTLKNIDQSLDFLREQMTIVEVNQARLHNYSVKLRQEAK